MKIKSLIIQNYKAIEKLEMKDLGQLVLIAGGNGVGKSCIFDAIRILKSSYGSYHQNEWQSFLNEFQINPNQARQNSNSLFRNKNNSILIELEIEISENERAFVKTHGKTKLESTIWNSLSRQNPEMGGAESSPSEKQRIFGKEFNRIKEVNFKEFDNTIESKLFKGKVEILPFEQPIQITPNIVLELLFSIYQPDLIGIIDYHGPNRNYQRENVTNLNMNHQNFTENKKVHALYNSQGKYHNVKNEIAASYVKALIAKESGGGNKDINSLDSTLQELFRIFFPTKQFLGINPTIDGNLEFPVKVGEGLTHDIDELSSGEKEILFGYLRLRNSTPKNSVILIDEPELHLNPLIAQKLPDFYYKTIGLYCDNQIWLVTHSEAILKESFGNSNYSVYHLRAATGKSEGQAKQLKIDSDIESVLIDLVGDLATYKPENKILLLEGENSEFDKILIQKLFPEYSKELNIISAGSKSNVNNLHRVLEKAVKEGVLDKKFYSITDNDYLSENTQIEGKSFKWDVYHIENYLLNPYYIQKVMQDTILNKNIPTIAQIEQDLKNIAEENIDSLTRQQVSNYTDRILYNSGVKPKKNEDLSSAYHSFANEVQHNISLSLRNKLSIEQLKKIENSSRLELTNSFMNEDWLKIFKGREILKSYSSRKATLRYEQFRNLIISKMAYDNYEPIGMKKVLEIIIND